MAFLNEKAGTEVAADGSGSKTAGLLPHVHDFLKGFREASKGEQETLLELASAKAGKDPESLSKWELYTKIAMKIIDQGAEVRDVLPWLRLALGLSTPFCIC